MLIFFIKLKEQWRALRPPIKDSINRELETRPMDTMASSAFLTMKT